MQPCIQHDRISTLEGHTGRLTALEVQMKELIGNGQPGRMDRAETDIKAISKTMNLGVGAILTLQAVTGLLVGLMAAGVIRVR